MPSDVIFSEEQLAVMVTRATTLEERLRGDLFEDGQDEALTQRRIDQWRERAAKGDAVLFEELLAMRGLDLEAAKRAVGRVKIAMGAEPPRWAELIQAGLAAGRRTGSEKHPCCDDANPLPFEQIAIPFVEAATEILRGKTGAGWLLLGEEGRIVVQRLLLGWIANMCAPALMLEFSIFRMMHSNGNGSRPQPPTGQGANQLYNEFVSAMHRERLAAFFAEYGVLARAVGTVMDNWAEATGEFLTRLASDKAELERTFHQGKELGPVEKLKAGLSDPHHNGRTVFAIQFASGVRAVYKPKSLDTEQAYGELLAWMTGHGLSLALRPTAVLLRPGYGWVEYLNYSPCTNDEELARFYRRCGMLLALFRVLGATDIHHENLIAAGEYPMVVDTETLITPPLRTTQPSTINAAIRAAFRLEDSIIQSRMLPSWRSQNGGGFYDMSGLGGVGGEEIPMAVWQSAHTDQMSRQVETAKLNANRNVPFPEGMPAAPARFCEDIVAGFREAYQLLLKHRGELAAENGPLQKLAASPMRLVFRDTQTYFSLLKSSLEPELLRDGIDRSIYLEALSRILLISTPRTRHAPLVDAEKRALEALDIPAFTLIPVNRALLSNGTSIAEEYFPECGYQKVQETLQRLDDTDCEEQVAVIRGTFYAKALNQGIRLSVGADAAPDGIEPADFLEAALGIARELERRAFHGDDGTSTWVGLHYEPSLPGYNYGTISSSLFSGAAGVAVFLAAVEHVAGGAGFRDLAYGALRTVGQTISTIRKKTKWNRSTDHDMEASLLAYPLLKAAQLLDDPAYIEMARGTTELVSSALATQPRISGIHFGAPGVLIGLIALHEAQRDDALLELALRCGDHVLAHRDSSAGREYSLARLHAATGEKRFAQNNPEAWRTWIEGPAGAGLASLARGGQEIEAALEAPLDGGDSLWDGVFGKVAWLIDAARLLRRPELLDIARGQASASLQRARRDGGLRCCTGLPPNAFVPGFYRGLAGIGYELLRLSSPEKLPALLLWQ